MMDKRILTACRLLMEVALSQIGEAESNLVETESDAASNPQFEREAFERLRQGQTADNPSKQTAEKVPDDFVKTASHERGEDSPSDRKAVLDPPVHAIHWHTGSKAPAADTASDAPERTDSMRAISEYFERDARRYGN